jgi:hypothetical protein
MPMLLRHSVVRPLTILETKTEFEKAAILRYRYWLYVMERAAGEDFEIYCINDPARRVNQFFCDNGWQVLAEDG